MKKLINKCSTHAFWVGLSSAIVVLVQTLGEMFGFVVDAALIDKLIMSICGVLVVMGFVSKDSVDEPTDKDIDSVDN